MARSGKTYAVIAGLLLVAIALGSMVYVDSQARSSAQQAFERVNSALAAGQSIDDAQVRSWLNRHPTRTYEGEDKKYYEVYEYPGVFRKRTVEVEYIKRAAALVNAVSIQ